MLLCSTGRECENVFKKRGGRFGRTGRTLVEKVLFGFPTTQVSVPPMSAFFFCRPSLGHPVLEAPESVTGPWKGDVNIPCTYRPLKGYTQVLVRWLVQRGSDPVTIFLRDSSGDHTQQAKYRGRLHINHEVLGDVSLQLKTLEMDDRSHYTCEVTWETRDGNQVVRDEIIELRVQKLPASKAP